MGTTVRKSKEKKGTKKEKAEINAFIPHLDELRSRLIAVIIFFISAMIISFVFSDKTASFLASAAGSARVTLAYFKPYEKFMAYLKIAFFAAVFITVPFAVLNAALFIRPALLQKEKRVFDFMAAAAPVVFFAGCVFGYMAVAPAAFGFFDSFMKNDGVNALWGMDSFYGFTAGLIIITGLIFIVPLPVAFLVKAGIITQAMVKTVRPYLIVGCFIVAAAVTPGPDPFTQILVAVPLYGLFELSAAAGRLI